MNWGKFWAGLKVLDPKLRVNQLPGTAWGLYKSIPRDPLANDHGHVHYFSIASPRWLGGHLPPEDCYIDGQFARGWRTVLRLLVDQGKVKDSKVRRVFGYRWRWGTN
jgi:hypothetical protein